MTGLAARYDDDFLLWTQEQAAALRRAKSSNLPLDWDNLAEEIESSGKSLRRELSSQIRRILRHLLAVSPAAPPRSGWRASVRAARSDAAQVLEQAPSLRRELDALIDIQARIAAELAAADLNGHGEPSEGVWVKLEQGGFTGEQVLGEWFPGSDTATPDRGGNRP